ncbi:MAG: choice-of-anchor Q domain-containing protein [Anaerolineaceae bacterium]
MKIKFNILSLLIAISLLLGLGVIPWSAQAQAPWIIKVNTTEDLRDFAHNGVCSAGHQTDGPCSLRAAIYEAARHHENVEIQLPPGVYKLSLTEPSYEGEPEDHYGDLDIPERPNPDNHFTIKGTGDWDNPSIIDANFIDRVMQIGKNQNVHLTNLVLKNGLTKKVGPSQEGLAGGGLHIDEAKVELTHVRLTNNEARGEDGFVSDGGAIYAYYSDITMAYCELDHNRSDVRSVLHASHSNNPIQIYSSSIHHNTINEGYSAHIDAGNGPVMTNSTMSDNQGGEYYIHGGKLSLIQNSTLISEGNVGIIWNRENLQLWFNILQIIPVSGVESGLICTMQEGHEPSLGGNIFSDYSCKPEIDDRVFAYSIMKLGPLGNYGGPTPTVSLMPGSPAIDYSLGSCTLADGYPLYVDQRMLDRDDGRCDTGSFELQSNEAPGVLFLPLTLRN